MPKKIGVAKVTLPDEPAQTLRERIVSWFKRRQRAAALRRLGGPDVDEERRKNAMNGEQKQRVLITWAALAFATWGVWQIFESVNQQHVLEAETQRLLNESTAETERQNNERAARVADMNPNPDTTLQCVETCARSCIATAEPLVD